MLLLCPERMNVSVEIPCFDEYIAMQDGVCPRVLPIDVENNNNSIGTSTV